MSKLIEVDVIDVQRMPSSNVGVSTQHLSSLILRVGTWRFLRRTKIAINIKKLFEVEFNAISGICQ
jgi:hypothetical protein